MFEGASVHMICADVVVCLEEILAVGNVTTGNDEHKRHSDS